MKLHKPYKPYKPYKPFGYLELALLCLLACSLPTATLSAQDVTCNAGDVAWVSSAVNADVGLASGAGRCLANTVAGGNYNDPLVPFGIQAAQDCACTNSIIHILGNTGNYGSATASWNNRFNATKSINLTTNIVVYTHGYATSALADSCKDDNLAVGCPVTTNFAGGTGEGWSNINFGKHLSGVLVEGATTTGISWIGGSSSLGGIVSQNNGGWGVDLRATSGKGTTMVRSTIAGNGSTVANTGGVRLRQQGAVMYSTINNNTGAGVQTDEKVTRTVYNIISNTVGDGIRINERDSYVFGNTIRRSTDSGVDILTAGSSSNAWGASFVLNIFADNGNYGINFARHSTRAAGVLMYNVFSGNATGTVNLTNMPVTSWVLVHGNDEATAVVFVSVADSNVVSGAELVLAYPSGNTPLVINAGVAPDAAGSGGGGAYKAVGAR